MNQLFINNYPEKFDEIRYYINGDIESETWRIARINDEMPHIGNIFVGELCCALLEQLKERGYVEDDNERVTFEVNGMASNIYVDGEEVHSYQEIVDKLK